MILVVLFCCIIIVANLANAHFDPITVLGVTFTVGSPIAVLLLPLRDSIQELHKRRMAFVAILVGTGAAATFTSFQHGVLAALTLIWVELLDFGLYTYFRKYGWMAGMIISDVVVSPLVPILYYFFSQAGIQVNTDVLIARYVVLVLVYVWIVATRAHLKPFGGYPMWKGVPWAKE